MCQYETKICPRCKSVFECKAGNINHCGCSVLVLDKALREWIETRFQDCLCGSCLKELANKPVFFFEKYQKGRVC